MNNFSFLKIQSLKESRFLKIWLMFTAIALLGYVARYPLNYASFENLFGDLGAAFKANELISNGYSPTVDFSYLYGLLPLVIGKVWFELFGATPQVFFIGAAISYIFSSAALAKIVISAKLGMLGILFIAISIPFFSFATPYWNFTYALEPVFITWALAEHLSGKRENALVFLVLGYFTKPSMSLLYALLIIGLYAKDLFKGESSIHKVFKEITLPCLTLISLLTFLGIVFGFSALVGSILSPIQGAAHYKAMNYGLFGIGGKFLYFSGVKIGYYLGSTGFWIISTIILFSLAILVFYRFFILKSDGYNNYVAEVFLTISILYFIFLIRFFAGNWSWLTYSYLIVIGLSLFDSEYMKSQRNQNRILLTIPTLYLLLGYYPNISNSMKLWSSFNPSDITLTLDANSEAKDEFSKILDYCRTKKVLIFGASVGGIDIFYPKCKSPDTWWILRGIYNQKEVLRVNNQISSSEIIILSKVYFGSKKDDIDFINYKMQLDKFEKYKEGKYFVFLRRK